MSKRPKEPPYEEWAAVWPDGYRIVSATYKEACEHVRNTDVRDYGVGWVERTVLEENHTRATASGVTADHDIKTIKRLRAAIRWALGYTNFRARKDTEGPYWWRSQLRKMAGPVVENDWLEEENEEEGEEE